MQKPEKISWKDTNLALIGSELDHKVKNEAAQGEEAWEGIGTKAELKIWRIEKFEVKPWPEEQYGQFFRGDSYVVLNSEGSDPDNLQHDLFIWIGSDSSQDEYGTAAYKMVECDDYLHGAAVQHREVEGNEASEFVDLFDSMQYLEGGIESGFNHVEPTEEKPFFYKFRVRENKKGELVQVPMSVSSMDTGSGFVLYASKSKVWAWHGQDLPPMEKIACTANGEKLCTMGTVTVLAQGQDDEEDEEFWNYLQQGDGGSGGTKSRSIRGPAPKKRSRGLTGFKAKAFSVDSDPTQPLQEVGLGQVIKKFAGAKIPALGRLGKSSLDANILLIDNGKKIFVWVGKDADPGEKVASIGAADRYAAMEPYAKELPVTVIKEGQEARGGFKEFFKN